MTARLDALILAAVDERITEHGVLDPMALADAVFDSIDPADHAAILRTIITQRIAAGLFEQEN